MKAQTQLERYIRNEDLNINYHGGTATNIFGTEYTVTMGCAEGYFDVPSVRYASREITIKNACGYYQDVYGVEDESNFMAHALAHELGHTETYMLGTGLALILATIGIKNAIQQKSPSALAKGLAMATAGKFFIDEILAEAAAYTIHSAPLEANPQWFKSLVDLL